MDILKNFGVDPVLMGAQIVNFLIIFYLLKRFLYKPVLGMLKKREDKIQEGLKQAEEARLTLEKTLSDEKKILAKAQDKAKEIVEHSRLQAKEDSKKIVEETRKQAEGILQEAKQQIEQESAAVEKRISEKVTMLASDMLTKSLEGFFGEKEQKQIASRVLDKIKRRQ